MLHAGDRVLVAVSGGPDSVALAHILHELAPRLSLTLGIAHLNHGLRPEAEAEARSVAQLARKLGLPFFLESRDVDAYGRRHGLSLEEAGRTVRYAFYKKVLREEGYRKVATGHHRDDNAEMVLMNLLRGAGPLGLSGIPAVRDRWVVRPLINLSREQIRAYLDHHRLASVSDPSNTDPRFTRNRIRHLLLPLIEKEFNPNIVQALHRTATIIDDENRWVASMTAPLCEAVIDHREAGRLDLDTTALLSLDRAPARRVLRRAIALLKGNLRRITFDHLDALMELSATGRENTRVDLPGLISAVKKTDRLVLKVMDRPRQSLEPERRLEPYAYLIEAHQVAAPDGLHMEIEAIGAKVLFQRRKLDGPAEMGGSGQWTALFDIDQLSFPLLLRNPQPGDRFTPLGMRGSKKLKKLFNERKVDPVERGRCPLLLSGGQIIWVLGHRQAETGKAGPQTRHILEVKYALPEIK
jgi:tRNA(Ile)-lysidine synthase